MARLASWLFLVSFLSFLLLSPVLISAELGSGDDDLVSILPEGAPAPSNFSAEDALTINQTAEQFEFQAEVTRLMDIIINSLYSKREIFIRELISNAADALDKIRFLALTNQTSLADIPNLDIKIAFDRDAKTISITDTGIGMSKEELVKNLGVVAKSGTSDFLEAAAKGNDALSLIGQFGVGFYSVYLVADRVTVVSKHPDHDQYIWESTADKTFSVSKDPRGNTLGRGTQVILHMKEDSQEFLNEHEIKKLVARYSEFINYPIYLYLSKMVDRSEVEAAKQPETTTTEETADTTDKSTTSDGEIEVADEEEVAPGTPEEPKATPSMDRVEQWYWSRLNDVKAIWTRSPADITEEEYNAFYQTLTKDEHPPLAHIHFTAEGEITFRAILFIPSKPPAGLYDKFYEKSTALKLYVRRVLISDEFDDFLPRYLNFIRGVVDSEDLPLNVSRETLAQSKVLRVMAKKLTRKVLEMLKKLSDANKNKRINKEEYDEEEEDYNQFWLHYGKSIKLGIIDDRNNKAKLIKLLRYYTSKSPDKLITLDEYIDRMPESQKYIYYITGENIETVSQSPFVEKLIQKDIEVVYMIDPVDEYLLQPLTEYDGTTLMSVTKEGLKINDDDESKLAKYTAEFKDLTNYLQQTLGHDRVHKVTVSNRIANSPMVIVTGQYGWTSNMERIMSGQTFANMKDTQHLRSKKTLEINPLHPLIREMKNRLEATNNEGDEQLKEVIELLWDASLLQSGFIHDKPKEFAQRIHRLTANALNVDPDAPLAEEESNSSQSESTVDDSVSHEEL